MKQVNQVVETLQPNLEYGTVVEISTDDTYEVEVCYGKIMARKAAGCLLQPQASDLVLTSVDIEGRCYILNILERKAIQGLSEIVVPGDCVMQSRSGSIEMRANTTLTMTAGDSIQVAGDSLEVNAHQAEVCISKMTVLGKILHTQVKRISTVARSIEQSLKRLTQRMETSERFVEDHEEVQTGSTRYLVEDTFTTHAGNTMNISEELHTMHAEQIHMS